MGVAVPRLRRRSLIASEPSLLIEIVVITINIIGSNNY